jgi:membrane protease YdiL (CAAX protease family)
MKKFVTKHPIIIFCLLNLILWVIIGGLNMTFFPSSFDYALMFPQWTPALSAIIVLGIANGKNGIKELFSKILIRKSSLKWSLVAVIIPIICCFVAYLIFALIEYKEFIPIKISRSIGVYFLFFIATVFGSFGEEIGWRGFMLPKLNEKYSLFISSLIVGLFWGFWHMRFHMGLPAFGMYIIVVVFFSFIFSWIYTKTNGNIFTSIVLHTSINMCNLLIFEHILSDITDIQTGIQSVNQSLYFRLFVIMALVFAIPCIFFIKSMFVKKSIN